MTGVAATTCGPESGYVIRLIHAAAKGNFLRQLVVEVEDLRRKGKIDEEYLKTKQAMGCFMELLDVVDRITPDPERLDAVKKIFISIYKGRLNDDNDPVPQQLLAIGGSLTAGEIILLSAVYKTHQEPAQHVRGESRWDHSAHAWLSVMASETKFKSIALVEIHETSLMDKKLLLPRRHSDHSGIELNSSGQRLTDLGVLLCKYLCNADNG